MDIQNVQLNKYGSLVTALVDGNEVTIPTNASNRFYAEILRKVDEEGLVIGVYAPPPLQPHTISKYTIITRLEAAGKFNEALAALKSDDLFV